MQKAFFLTVLTLRKISIRDGSLIQLKKSVIILAICRRQWILVNICFQFTIILADENRLIGDMGISFTNHNNMQAELGCTLHKDYQKKGYATEALKAMVDYLFGTLDKHRIIASVDPRNTASIQLIERLGFRKEAHFKESYYLRGDWVDDIIYAQLKTEWGNNDKYSKEEIMIDTQIIALQFNECISRADINALSHPDTKENRNKFGI